ncbi:MAG TPA: Hsp70 family protein [Pyrinomonadaceae bacterium]|nr:Hsp70 family protein [Pyrinomonadaceae bacterium]
MEASSRFLIGIDLGTTNTALAYVDTEETPARAAAAPVRVFEVPQLVAEGELRTLPSLPSFLYFVDEDEAALGGTTLPWDAAPQDAVVGVLARERGALVPGRQVASAKSWLCLSAVDRTADILPWGAEQADNSCSPVAASARYLSHLRDAWNHSMAPGAVGGAAEELRFERQAVVLTVPASFDEEARELTVSAAREAGLENLTLLEEPLAAFYAWISAQRGGLKRRLKDGQLVLVCDVGGGTTDFSLIRVRVEEGEVRFERTAIGEHLLLGGDNVDLALARRVEEKLGSPRLSLRQQNALRRQCCAAKERLLGESAVESVPVTVLGGGRSVVGGALSTELTRAEVEEVLAEGFLPLSPPDDLPANDRRVGLRELGLPYAGEPAITKHLAAFLMRAAVAMSAGQSGAPTEGGQGRMARPDAILFNGGFFHPPLARERVVAAVAGWFSQTGKRWRPKVLNNETPETAVAVGAAYYARVRRGGGIRISGGSGRGYYIGVQPSGRGGPDDPPPMTGVCVLPRGTEEGTRLELDEREFEALTNRPVSFTLYSTTTRHDGLGAVVPLTEDEMHRHAPLVTVLRYGKRSRHLELDVRLTTHFTEVGTLELWCEAPKTGHRWRLQFQLRGADTPDEGDAEAAEPATPEEITQIIIPNEAVREAEKLIRAVFGGPRDSLGGEMLSPEALPGRLESVLGYRKDAWPTETIRRLCDVLAELPAGRRKGRNYEARWLNLFGFCLRPGFGAVLDEWRVTLARKVYHEGLCFEKDVQCQVEWLILWQRVAGGMNAGQQLEMYERHRSRLGVLGKKVKGRINRQVEREGLLLLASLEHLPPQLRVELGDDLLGRIEEEPGNKSYTWALGRLGARVPFYGPLNCVVPAGAAARWAASLLALPELTIHVAASVAQLVARVDDPLRDVEAELRQEAIGRLEAAGAGEELLEGLRVYVPPSRAAAVRIFGESLPEGLRLLG